MKVPQAEGAAGPERFLINPYGVYFEEMTASALVEVDLDGAIVSQTPYFINPAGFTIHSAVHAARPEVACVMHLHTDAGVGVSAQAEGLLPLGQNALIVLPQLAHHDYEGIALNLDERTRLVANLGDKSLMLLRNHGTLSAGRTAAQAGLGSLRTVGALTRPAAARRTASYSAAPRACATPRRASAPRSEPTACSWRSAILPPRPCFAARCRWTPRATS